MSRATRVDHARRRRRDEPGKVVKPLAVEQLIGVAAGLAKAVAGMHGRGVMHRDICPANIVISSDGAPCLVGFGIGDVAGRDTPRVHSPHQNCRDAAIFGAGADRAYRSAGGSARRLVRVGRDIV